MTNWERWIKRYVWDDERTPYLVAPERMTKRQADYEIFAYCVFLCCLFIVASLAMAASPPMTFYAFAAVCAAIILGATKQVLAAGFCATAPIAIGLYLIAGGFPGNLGNVDYVVLTVLLLLWARYGLRIVSVAKSYEQMSDA